MGKIDKSLKKVINFIKRYDIIYFGKDRDTIMEFIDYSKKIDKEGKKINTDMMYDFLIKHEDKIDIEKIIVIAIKNCRDNIEELKNRIKRVEKDINYYIQEGNMEMNFEKSKEKFTLDTELTFFQKELQRLKDMGKGIDISFAKYRFNEKKGKYDIEVIDSKEIIRGKKILPKEKLERIERIEEDVKKYNEDENDEMGIEYLLQLLRIEDYTQVFSEKAKSVVYMATCAISDNEILRMNNITHKELERLKNDESNKYEELLDSVVYNTPEVLKMQKDMIKDYIQYIDIDKLLLICGFRYEELLEQDRITEEQQLEVKDTLSIILKNIEANKNTYKFNLDIEEGEEIVSKEIVYSKECIRKCLEKFSKDSYFSEKRIEEIREKIKNGKMKIEELSFEEINICFDHKSLLEYATTSEENFAYIIENFEYIIENFEYSKEELLGVLEKDSNGKGNLLNYLVWNSKYEFTAEDILNLYINNVIDLNTIMTLGFALDFSNIININELYRIYEEKDEELFEKYTQLYKKLFSKDKTIDFDEFSSDLMAEIIERYDSENKAKHIQTIKDFYKSGILKLETIVEWNDDDVLKKVVQDLYAEEILNYDELKPLLVQKKIPFECVRELVFNQDIGYEERLKILFEGLVPEEEILKLYQNALIRKEDLIELANQSIITAKEAQKAIQNTNILTLEENSNIRLEIGKMKKIKKDDSIYNFDESCYNPKIECTQIIDPNAREELFDLLHAYVIPRKMNGIDCVEVDKSSPFYNYTFYGIPDENGKITEDSVIIAERIYEDIETKTRFAVDNATYFFKYGDLLVLSNYASKDEIVKQIDNMVFRVNHILATEDRYGSWGFGVLNAIAKTKFSSNFKGLTKKEQRIKVVDMLSDNYTHSESDKIIEKAQEIDNGEHTYDIVSGKTNNIVGQQNNGEDVGDSR